MTGWVRHCGALALTLLLAGAGSAPAQQAGDPPVPVEGLRLLFKAGFEEPVTLEHEPMGQQAWLHGTDASGQSWSDLDHLFELVAPGSFDELVTLRLSDERSHSGRRSLYMRQNVQESGTQARLQFFSNDPAVGNEIFTRRYYYIPSVNLTYLTKDEQATSIAGTREIRGPGLGPGGAGFDFSMPLYAVRMGERLVFAQAIVDYSAGRNWSDWTRPPKGLLTYGRSTPVPLDRWFRLDIYILRDSAKGKIKVWVDDELIFDLADVRTKNSSHDWFTKLADIDSEPAPFELFADDVEIWTR